MSRIPFIIGIRTNSFDGNVDFTNRVISSADHPEGSLAKNAAFLQDVPRVNGEGMAINHSCNGLKAA